MNLNFVRLHICVVLAVTIMMDVLESQRPKFREDYRYEKEFGAFYKLHKSASPWSEARVRCQAEGARLMLPQSLDEAEILSILTCPILNKFKGAFIGLHDLFAEKFFVTEQGYLIHNTMLELLWEAEEPLPGAGRCVAVRRNGRFFVHPCNESLPYICKVKEKNYQYYNQCDTYNPNWKLRPGSNTCYLVHKEPQKWDIAYATCLSAGGHLVILNDHKEAKFIKDLFKKIPVTRIPITDFAFIGFSDHFQRHHYRTVHGDRIKEMGYQDWDNTPKCNNETDNKALLKTDHNCGGIRRNGLLATINCDIPAIFFCEKPASKPANSTLLRTSNEALNTQPTVRQVEMRINYDDEYYDHSCHVFYLCN